MKCKVPCFLAILILWAISSGFAADNRKTVALTGWGIDGTNLDTFITIMTTNNACMH